MAQTAVRDGRIRLQYIVCDGASSDGTLAVVRQICGDRAEIVSAEDRGMYDGLSRRLRHATGEVVSYINAGDYYSPTALDVVADVFEQQEVEWVVGLNVVYNQKGHPIYMHLPYRPRRRFALKALYGSRLLPFFIQQESTFWRRRLLSLVDWDRFVTYRLAGDSYLWQCFAREAEPIIVESFLGGWAVHSNQLSSDRAGYERELRTMRKPMNFVDVGLALFDRAERLAPTKVRKWLNPRGLLRYSLAEERWV